MSKIPTYYTPDKEFIIVTDLETDDIVIIRFKDPVTNELLTENRLYEFRMDRSLLQQHNHQFSYFVCTPKIFAETLYYQGQPLLTFDSIITIKTNSDFNK